MTTPEREQEPLLFSGEDDGFNPPPDESDPVWRVLIVDDDDDVYRATCFALSDTCILGRHLEFLKANSAHAARQLLQREHDVACVLLDVVMETEHAGLDLVDFIRNELDDHRVQIIIRTGQPGYAPELSVIREYDINDYRAKSELTHTRLVTTLTAAIRAYDHLATIESSREGLETLIEGAARLVNNRDPETFCRGVLQELEKLLHDGRDALICRECSGADRWEVLAASGKFGHHERGELDPFSQPDLVSRFREVFSGGEIATVDEQVLVPIGPASGEHLMVVMQTATLPTALQRRLLKLFAVNVAVGYDNARMFEQVERLAYFDELTGAPNRAAMVERIGRFIGRGQRFALLVLDIDHFQTINDGLGWEAGDRMLRAFIGHLREAFGHDALIGRLSGDGFAVVVPGADAGEVEGVFDALCRRLAGGVEVYDYEIPLTVTGGLVMFPDHGDDAGQLFHNVGIALKHGKRQARSTLCHFTRDFERKLQQRLKVARDLGTGISHGELVVRYQPRIALSSYRVTGAEALVRWNRSGDILRPREFIDAAEESGLIVDVGRYVLTEACRRQVLWQSRHGIDLTVSVNVSMRQLRDIDFLNVVDETLKETGVDPSCVEFEVTESAMIEDADIVQHILSELRTRGTRIAVDDFGTGYSSLSYLQKLPLDRVKIDQSFVAGVDKRKEDRVIVSMIINMSHLLNFQVVAEGVETLAQQEQLEVLGCDEAQGHYFARPLIEDEIPGFVSAFNRR